MKFYTTTTEQVLEAALLHLQRNGYSQVDVRKLAQAYEAFQRATQRKIYGSATFPSLATLVRAIDDDIKLLVAKNLVQRSVSRVSLLPRPAGQLVVRFKLDPLFAPLYTELDLLFPLLAALQP